MISSMLLNALRKNFFILLFILFFPILVNGAQDDKLKGYAWSDGAGWISFNCSNTNSCAIVDYGVTADSFGNLSGYAWSDNLGWLSFNQSDMVGIIGVEAPKIDKTTGLFSGHALFVSGSSDSDGWLGLVELKPNDTYGAKLDFNNYEVGGWAWGDVNVGWISFNCSNTSSCDSSDYQVTYDPFYFLFTASKGLSATDKVPHNGSVVLSWTTSGAVDHCLASNGTSDWVASNPKPLGEPSIASQTISNLTNDTKFSLSCHDISGHTITRDLNILVNPPMPIVTMGADDTNIAYNTATNLNWDALNVSSCVGNWPHLNSPKSIGLNQTESSGNLITTSFFSLDCQSNNQAVYPGIYRASVTIDVEKLKVNLRADKNQIPYGERAKLYYSTEFPLTGSCVASGTLPGWAGTNIDETPGEHEFVTPDPMVDGGHLHTAILTCDGSNGQHQSASVNLNIRKNPNYREV